MATVVAPRPDVDPSTQKPPTADQAESAEEYQQNLNKLLICRDCNEYPPNLIEEFSSGDMVCGSCGLVLGDRIIDTRSEWRTFANDDQGGDDPSRVGDAGDPILDGQQLQTNIAFGEGMRSRELHRAQNRSNLDKSRNNQKAVFAHIASLCDGIQLAHSTVQTAQHIFKLTDDAKLFKGKPQDCVIAGCIFIACRQTKQNRTFKEVYSLTHVSKKEIGRTFKTLEKFLQNKRDANTTKLQSEVVNYEDTVTTGASDLCERFCTSERLNFPEAVKVEKIAKALTVKSASLSALAGRSPLSIAAASIYMASHFVGWGRSSKDIAEVAGVSDGTIRTAYRLMHPYRDELIEKEWLSPKGPGSMDRLPPA
ncbi:cyclin-like protein [Hypoxylon fuscum]|nr:cyclin-like protein [Hypoxylon fuscum]